MLEGVVTNTSIMANVPGAEQSLGLLRSHGLLKRLGLHLNLTEGAPLSPPSGIPSLLQPGSGKPQFLGKVGFRRACDAGDISSEEVEKEARAQLEWFVQHVGHPPVHLDGHQHSHVVPQFVLTLAALFAEMGVKHVRAPMEHVDEHNEQFSLCPVCSLVSEQGVAARKQFLAHGLCCLDAFVGLTFCGQPYTASDVEDALHTQLAAGARSVEMMTHPGLTELGGDNEAEHVAHLKGFWGAFSVSEDRADEVNVLCDPKFRNKIQRIVRIVCFEDVGPDGYDRTLWDKVIHGIHQLGFRYVLDWPIWCWFL